jgi:hypothetical protein
MPVRASIGATFRPFAIELALCSYDKPRCRKRFLKFRQTLSANRILDVRLRTLFLENRGFQHSRATEPTVPTLIRSPAAGGSPCRRLVQSNLSFFIGQARLMKRA